MNNDPITTIVTQFATLFGNDAARFMGAAMVLVIVAAHGIMPWIPVPVAGGAPWYRHVYTVLKFISGNYGNAAPSADKP